MAEKTITLDPEAYALLSQHKREGQSFSQVIKEHFSAHKTGRELKAVLHDAQVSDSTLDAIDAQVAARKGSLAKAPAL